MNFQTNTVTLLAISNTVEDWRAILADDTEFKKELRAKLAELRASDDTRNNIAFGEPQRHVDGASIQRAAKKQNAKIKAKRFLARTGAGAFPCD